MGNLTELQEQIVGIFLVLGLIWALTKIFYERITKEKFTVSNIVHPIGRITTRERHFIAEFLVPYRHFSTDQKRAFLKRFAWFKSKKPFVFYGGIENEEEIKAYITASAIVLTMGMQNFRFQRSVSRIVVYPSKYYSNISERHHVGEYNPGLKTLVFSADDLEKGFEIPNDNMNLGIHEMAHALCFETGRKKNWEARRFQFGLRKLTQAFNNPSFMQDLKNDGFFREYGQKNVFEFFAVITETYIENPATFLKKYPQLYQTIRIMYNFDFENPLWRHHLKRSP